MKTKLMAVAFTAALFAANPLSASDAESGFLKAQTPVCPTLGEVRALWNILLSGRFQQAVEVVNAGDCFLAEGPHMYLAKERLADAAQVTVVADDRESGGELEIYSDWYKLLGGMECLINCPPGALGYFD